MGKRGRAAISIVLSDEERDFLERQVGRHRVARSLSERCRIILKCAEGMTSKAVGVHEHTVGKWRRRFRQDRIDGLLDEPRSDRPRRIEDDEVARVVEMTLQQKPKDE